MTESLTSAFPIGTITVYCENNSIVRVRLDELLQAGKPSSDPLLRQAQAQLEEYFSGTRKEFSLPCALGTLTAFQRDVLELTSRIPYGEVCTYGQIASSLGKPQASRAVGAALARNPLPILIPCHRVVAANGHLTGYLGRKGIAGKKLLLELEGHTIVGDKLG